MLSLRGLSFYAAFVTIAAALVAVSPIELPDASLQFRDNGQALLNPGMGWVFHYYDNSLEDYGSRLKPGDTLDSFPGMAVAYMRLPWAYLEPEKGHFKWELIDDPARSWRRNGKRIAFRFTCSESGEPAFATPEWVRKAGAKGFYFEPDKGIVPESHHWEPDYDDPVFLDALDHFLERVAERYDGKPELDFVDVGSFGVWGEGHTLSSTRRAYNFETLKRIIDLYRKYFRHTLLVCNDDFAMQGRGREVIDYCQANGLSLRDDSILVGRGPDAYLSAGLAQSFWPLRPVILESQYYNIPRDAGYWEGGRKYAEAVEAYHASYVSVHWSAYEFLKDNKTLIESINQRLGYRLVLLSAQLPGALHSQQNFQIAYMLRNAGVAPCYQGGHPAFTLRSERGLEQSFVDSSFDVKTLAPGAVQSRSFEVRLPALANGLYSIWFSIVDSSGQPSIFLPLSTLEEGKRYRLADIAIR